ELIAGLFLRQARFAPGQPDQWMEEKQQICQSNGPIPEQIMTTMVSQFVGEHQLEPRATLLQRRRRQHNRRTEWADEHWAGSRVRLQKWRDCFDAQLGCNFLTDAKNV